MEEKNYKDVLLKDLDKDCTKYLQEWGKAIHECIKAVDEFAKAVDEYNPCQKELLVLKDLKKELIEMKQKNAELSIKYRDLYEEIYEYLKQLIGKLNEQHIDSGHQFKNFCWTQSVYDINPTREDLMELKSMSENHKHFIDLIKLNYKCNRSTAYRWLKKFNIPSDRRRRGE